MIKDDSDTCRVKYGFLPKSIWYVKKDGVLTLFAKDGVGEDSYGKGAPLSEFNPVIASRIIRYWSNKGDKILDPFAGRTRMLIAWNLDRHYTGFEISPSVFTYLESKMCQQKRLYNKELDMILLNQDSKLINYENEFDLVFTCPPYWDVEDYNKLYEEKVEGQLGSIHNYTLFLKEYEVVIKNVYKALKPDKFCVWVVGDIRRDKTLIPFHVDTINIFLRCGFKLHDIVINELNSLSLQGLSNCDNFKYTAKQHEYILVFKK